MVEFTGICLITTDVLALGDFYAKVLDMEPEGDENHLTFRFQNCSIAIFSQSGMREMAPRYIDKPGIGKATIALQVDDVHQEYQRMLTVGVDMLKPIETYPWKNKSFWFYDPDKNIVDFYQII